MVGCSGWPALRSAGLALACALATLCCTPAVAGTLAAVLRQASTDHCSGAPTLSADAQDRLLLLADGLHQQLQRVRPAVALIARSGIDLSRLGQRYSHAGLVLPSDDGQGWVVRQLYYACDERRPRLFDQGLAGFVMGMDRPDGGQVSLLMLPPGDAAQRLAAAARDRPLALGLVARDYSASAYAHSTRYQNCNQWLVELIGSAWGAAAETHADNLVDTTRDTTTGTARDTSTTTITHTATNSATKAATDTAQARAQAQAWLADAGYRPAELPIGPGWLMALASWLPLVHLDDHPPADRAAGRLHVAMPAAIDAFVQRRLPEAQRVWLCHAPGRVLLRLASAATNPETTTTEPLDEACTPGPHDQRLVLD